LQTSSSDDDDAAMTNAVRIVGVTSLFVVSGESTTGSVSRVTRLESAFAPVERRSRAFVGNEVTSNPIVFASPCKGNPVL